MIMAGENKTGIAYVLKVYPRFSQTFVMNEILAHEESGLPLDIFSMRLSDDTRFHEALARVKEDRGFLGHVEKNLKTSSRINEGDQ